MSDSRSPDPGQPEREVSDMFWIDSATEETHGAHTGGGLLVNVHSPRACEGRNCVMHNPSDHHMRAWPTNWRGDRGLMERICRHGIGHPDPDALAYHVSVGEHWQGMHGCDGCCRPEASTSG